MGIITLPTRSPGAPLTQLCVCLPLGLALPLDEATAATFQEATGRAKYFLVAAICGPASINNGGLECILEDAGEFHMGGTGHSLLTARS